MYEVKGVMFFIGLLFDFDVCILNFRIIVIN